MQDEEVALLYKQRYDDPPASRPDIARRLAAGKHQTLCSSRIGERRLALVLLRPHTYVVLSGSRPVEIFENDYIAAKRIYLRMGGSFASPKGLTG
jgi:hypothetical protein